MDNIWATFLDITNRACLRKITLHLQQNAFETLWQIFHITFTRTLYFILCANKHAVRWDMWVDSIYNLLLLLSKLVMILFFTISPFAYIMNAERVYEISIHNENLNNEYYQVLYCTIKNKSDNISLISR